MRNLNLNIFNQLLKEVKTFNTHLTHSQSVALTAIIFKEEKETLKKEALKAVKTSTKKQSKTDILLAEATARNIKTRSELSFIMDELNINSGTVFNKVAEALNLKLSQNQIKKEELKEKAKWDNAKIWQVSKAEIYDMLADVDSLEKEDINFLWNVKRTRTNMDVNWKPLIESWKKSKSIA